MIKLEERDYKLLERVSDKLSTKYEILQLKDEHYIESDNLLVIVEDLLDRINDLEEELEDKEQELHQEPIKDYYDEYGVSRNDF